MTAMCICRCGYRCGGPGRCPLDPFVCLSTNDGKHFIKDCTHDFSGPAKSWEIGGGGFASSVTCVTCGVSALEHDVRSGP